MNEFLSTWGAPSAGGAIFIVVLMVLTGWLVPRKTFEDMKAERDHYRSLSERQNEANILHARTNAESLEQQHVVTHILQEIPIPTGSDGANEYIRSLQEEEEGPAS